MASSAIFYDPATDIIINPSTPDHTSGRRSAKPAPRRLWRRSPRSLIPQRPDRTILSGQQTARLVFEYSARSLLRAKRPTNADLRPRDHDDSAEELEKLLAGTPGLISSASRREDVGLDPRKHDCGAAVPRVSA
ncbi:type IV secretion system DNA-binding domain-containing protein [Cereibacter sphaeroides]|uniref:type IV secretion system DNA-binding domain-containing protein n=1 Tax=Cereibacter sphaeroides TaxID=1063 RepID=UPI001F3515E7|nr:type IV secretion system DNA-binding domain-containing protein [Cereibacter sphaeroides]